MSHHSTPTDPLVAEAIAALSHFTITRANAPALLAIWKRADELSMADRAAVLDHFGPREPWSPPLLPQRDAAARYERHPDPSGAPDNLPQRDWWPA